MEPVCRRFIDQYAALHKYFVSELQKHEKTMLNTAKARYMRLKVAFSDPVTLVYINFVAFLSSSVMPFQVLFQSNQPLVHILYDKSNELVRQCMSIFLNPAVVAKKEGQDLLSIICDLANN